MQKVVKNRRIKQNSQPIVCQTCLFIFYACFGFTYLTDLSTQEPSEEESPTNRSLVLPPSLIFVYNFFQTLSKTGAVRLLVVPTIAF